MVSVVNSKADVLKASAALSVNASAARGLSEILRSNLGPRGAVKMLVGGAGQIKITKDGQVLLSEMQIQHPTASMIARAATAQDDITGDGSTSNVLILSEIMKLAERVITDGVHARVVVEGIEKAREEVLSFLDGFRVWKCDANVLLEVAKTSLRTKLNLEMADKMAEIVRDAVLIVQESETVIDLHMVEMMTMKERLASETRLVKGLVLDHGGRHPDMPKEVKNCYILTLNVSLEYEKTEVHSSFLYSSAEQRDMLVDSERKFTDEKVRKIVQFKQKVCPPGSGKNLIVINQKGIDGPSLEMLARAGIVGLRRAKRRNMERLVLACGGQALNSVEDLCVEDLGWADHVSEKSLGDDKFTFIEGVKNPKSCTILVKGPNDHVIAQFKDAVKDGLRAVTNTILDKCVIPGAGSFEVAAADHLMKNVRPKVSGKAKLGVQVFADALLVIPKTLAENSGLDAQDVVLKLQDHWEKEKVPAGLDLVTGDVMSPEIEGVWDNYIVKKQMIGLAPVLAEQLLLVDEVIRAGRQMKPE
jgi:T-complex protein 1 subunit zeta